MVFVARVESNRQLSGEGVTSFFLRRASTVVFGKRWLKDDLVGLGQDCPQLGSCILYLVPCTALVLAIMCCVCDVMWCKCCVFALIIISIFE